MTATLLIRLSGPLQSWGVRSRFTDRDTSPRPTKSGVIGLLAAADGHDRDERRDLNDDYLPLSTLATLRFGVRADRPGRLIGDFHTVGGGQYPIRSRDLITDHNRAEKFAHQTETETNLYDWYGAPKGIRPARNGVLIATNTVRSPIVTRRWYLADAAFVAAVQSDSADVLHRLASRLQTPRRMVWLGRKSCPPSAELNGGVHPGDLDAVLRSTALLPNATTAEARAWLEVPHSTPGAIPTNDQPISFASRDRAHALRWELPTTIAPHKPAITWEPS